MPYLSSRGIAALRYDKRGIAQSGSLLRGETPAFSVYAEDVAKAVDFVRAESGADPAKVFIIGHSEGAVLAIKAALMREDVAGIVLVLKPVKDVPLPYGDPNRRVDGRVSETIYTWIANH